ncbi:hypothetical protein EVJ32_05170 [Exiguobacterium sp. SH5S4]|uniref:hypothetical protein n=1 Tax=Exiguobacterium sp. SH5S4 TaxID=2510961 RepID=UPI00103AFF27|nr:hypothetical protein [Exiguobacterium sp. SH5S4]TCI26769.1 hypothetical protein EVJ32_05170 [Exiguobacterium sp. SH5S4]
MAKKLRMKDLNGLNELYKVTERVWLVEEELYVDVRQMIRPSEIDTMLGEMLAVVNKAQELELDDMLDPHFIDDVMMCFMIKHFTTTEFPEKMHQMEVEDVLSALKEMIDTDYYEKIAKAFPQTETEKIYERMLDRYKQLAVASRTATLIEKAFKEMPIANDEIKKLMTNV